METFGAHRVSPSRDISRSHIALDFAFFLFTLKIFLDSFRNRAHLSRALDGTRCGADVIARLSPYFTDASTPACLPRANDFFLLSLLSLENLQNIFFLLLSYFTSRFSFFFFDKIDEQKKHLWLFITQPKCTQKPFFFCCASCLLLTTFSVFFSSLHFFNELIKFYGNDIEWKKEVFFCGRYEAADEVLRGDTLELAKELWAWILGGCARGFLFTLCLNFCWFRLWIWFFVCIGWWWCKCLCFNLFLCAAVEMGRERGREKGELANQIDGDSGRWSTTNLPKDSLVAMALQQI